MPQFAPNEEKVAIATFPVKPAGLECTVVLGLSSDIIGVATSEEIPFVATGVDQSIALPITMPGVEGTYSPYLSVFSSGMLIATYKVYRDVIVVTPHILEFPLTYTGEFTVYDVEGIPFTSIEMGIDENGFLFGIATIAEPIVMSKMRGVTLTVQCTRGYENESLQGYMGYVPQFDAPEGPPSFRATIPVPWEPAPMPFTGFFGAGSYYPGVYDGFFYNFYLPLGNERLLLKFTIKNLVKVTGEGYLG